jgi:ATP-dependent Clp protease protease subunit
VSARRRSSRASPQREELPDIPEIALVGDLHEREAELIEKLLDVEPGRQCTLYFDTDGGSAYVGLALMSLIRYRRLKATAVVLGGCMSAALLPFAACTHRLVFAHSVFLFHPMRWESGENVDLSEATEWARHFGELEGKLDDLLAAFFRVSREQIDQWSRPGRYLSGRDLVEAGLAELVDLRAPVSPGAAPGKHKTDQKSSLKR